MLTHLQPCAATLSYPSYRVTRVTLQHKMRRNNSIDPEDIESPSKSHWSQIPKKEDYETSLIEAR